MISQPRSAAVATMVAFISAVIGASRRATSIVGLTVVSTTHSMSAAAIAATAAS